MLSPDFIHTEASNGVPRRSLVLAGGGVRLAYQAGVLLALQEEGLQFHHVDGTSGGIFNTAMLASGLEPYEMCERWRSLKVQHFMSLRPAKKYLKLASMMAFGDADGIRQKVFPHLGIALHKIKANSTVAASFNVCNFSSKSIEAISHTEATEDHLIAGVSLPIFMPAIKIGEDWYTDAVWIKDANLMEAVRRGAEEIWLVWAIGNTSSYLSDFFNQYVHMIEMSANGALLEEYAQIKALNERIIQGDSPYGQRKPIVLHIIKPHFPLPLDPDLFLKKVDTNSLINCGYEDAIQYLKQKKCEGVAYEAHSTQMQTAPIAYTFRHTFEGKLLQNKVRTEARFAPYFTLRESQGKLMVDMVASFYFAPWKREISTKENQARIIKQSKASYLETSSVLFVQGKSYQLVATIQLSSVSHWWLGLEFKKVSLKLYDQQELLAEGCLRQSAKVRLAQLFNHQLKKNGQGGTYWKEKYRMIKKLYTYEI
ncbi:patatin-like phospholipase family protein [Porifericola rhodea]|uniref:patatin-like phospholipase family protein n=1 Tax=Porifericola rhodea TaxID=930972 RepID=UPI0026670477|nr:patatin-like phospholipase family protein [Porifericola rhodea]WKN29689.1 patatin-like phospholipase family protein [Porifericola rhodea]